MPESLPIHEFLARAQDQPVLDVRTPDEFGEGRWPGAHNVPLFSNDERAQVGTIYKHDGRNAAVRLGLELVGPNMRALVEQVDALDAGTDILVHCWRGGMRSASVAWLLEQAGYRTATLDGGYKALRRFVLETLATPREVHILGGMTGSGKTDILHELRSQGEQILDLEGLAHHKGSVFGGLGEPDQPSQQLFENRLGLAWHVLDTDRPVWIEDESRRIGHMRIPEPLWKQMKRAPIWVLDVPDADRLDRLVELYGTYNPDALAKALHLIERRLGGKRTSEALEALERGDLRRTCELALHYYDRAYRHGLNRRPDEQKIHVQVQSGSVQEAVRALRATTDSMSSQPHHTA